MSTSVLDSVVYRHLWGTDEVRGLLDETARLQGWLDILAKLAEAQAEVGIIPADCAQMICEHADVALLDIDEIAEQTRATGHSTLGLIRCLQQVLPEPAREWVYYGATVQDLTDTWFATVMRSVGDIVQRDLKTLESEAVRLAVEHRDTIMCGRTHGQPGLPITFGYKAAVWVSELRRHLERLREGRTRWEFVQLGGALGTMEFWGDAAVPMLRAFARRMELKVPEIPWLTSRDRISEFVTLLAMISATIGKIGQEIYELQRPEIDELQEPHKHGTVGSITMPHKVNPEISEHLVTLSRLVRADASVALEGILSEHERDGRSWKCEWVVVPEACQLACVATRLAIDLLSGLRVNTQRMRDNLIARGGYVQSAAALRTLSGSVGKHTAQQLLYDATMKGIGDRSSLAEALLSDSRIHRYLTADQIADVIESADVLGSARYFIDTVIQNGGAS
ncbi:adenylosuccinate lyase (plasmid) [Mycolicibacterium chubuense NBB4]|uniref:Adenylosuccinate lyase n=1 Tax=Mycolicibacterium chubuense (strain NBB4) TaxID=710421 RepID=I4BTG1_MYCCN|nr:adenylosuccinate lyase family protein [Mycolicibacterium chubuense]AFM20568.1 adenylosuccinate lyase [Mycolicibacterium chubuense NBB4]